MARKEKSPGTCRREMMRGVLARRVRMSGSWRVACGPDSMESYNFAVLL